MRALTNLKIMFNSIKSVLVKIKMQMKVYGQYHHAKINS